MTETPERRLASRIVEIHDLHPPVNVVALAREYAELEIVEWAYKCDGLTVGLVDLDRPKIFVKATTNHPRQRFTIAHELGHVILPWHIDTIAFHAQVEAGAFTGGLREREASTFASHLLVPDRFLSPLCSGEVNVAELLKELERADVSAAAGLIALTQALPPGFAFVLDGDEIFSSRGTVLPAPTLDWRSRSKWTAAAAQHGRTTHRGKNVRWFKFEQFESPQIVADPRDTTQLLRDAIAAVTDDPREQKALLNSVNGVIGYAMTPNNRTSPERALATMRHRLRGKPSLADLLEEPDFELFLHRRAISLSEN